MIDYYETKAHPITKKMVLDAFKEIKANGKAAGVDGVSLEEYGVKLSANLYKLWNRLTSGSYYPANVREKLIPKKDGGYRSLGIATVEDRIAQQVVKAYLEPKVDHTFHPDSYGYRRNKNAHQALQKSLERCYRHNWVLDLDIKSFFDTIDHELMLKALRHYTNDKWILLYVERWLKAGTLKEDGSVETRTEGSVQGSVISPLLANIFLHFTLDKWMEKYFPNIPFERYCDDAIIHCKSEKQAIFMKEKIAERMKECRLTLNMEKTHIAYCRSKNRMEKHKNVSFDFLGHTYRPKWCKTKNGNMLLFTPVMSRKAKKSVTARIREMEIYKFSGRIQELAKKINQKTRGWINYYCVFNKWETVHLWWRLNLRLTKWVANYRKMNIRKAEKWLSGIYKTNPGLFEHWKLSHP
nr:group II intron reverse transcriptase/maturase [Terrimonas sp. H1YJ31]